MNSVLAIINFERIIIPTDFFVNRVIAFGKASKNHLLMQKQLLLVSFFFYGESETKDWPRKKTLKESLLKDIFFLLFGMLYFLVTF